MMELLYISPIHASLAVLLFPLLAFLYQAVRGKRGQSGIVVLIAIVLSTISSVCFVFFQVWQKVPMESSVSWFTVGEHTFSAGILLNNLTVLMQSLVCIIALPVHLYSKVYMKGDPGIHRYWMYLSLFCFAMLALSVANNLLLMYVFWELVGFASYLLIGFWFTKDAAVQANKKAFIINRIGDLGFLIGIALVYTHLGTLDLSELFGKQSPLFEQLTILHKERWMTYAGLAFFVGAMAKSAQFPLHVWLPDAMEGPTSVSSLIHAATMVAAGVFLLATVFPLFNESILLVIAIVGTITALTASYFALAQQDIKKVLAFSTVSQLGFMVVAVGIGAWNAAMFHLVTHAFFKCLLFLCAGAIIHEMAHAIPASSKTDPQDMRNMGGLRRFMPYTFTLMVIASLALAGFPLTSGFLSKDSIIIATFEWAMAHGGAYLVIPIVLVLVSYLTAFYIGRMIFKVFFGKPKLWTDEKVTVFHEAPKGMLIPMAFLGLCSLFFAFSFHPISHKNAALMQGLLLHTSFQPIDSLHLFIPILLICGSAIGWWLGYRWYVQGKYPLKENNLLVRHARQQGYINEFYQGIIVQSTLYLSRGLYWFDYYIVDGFTQGAASLTRATGRVAAWVDRYLVDGFVNAVAQASYYSGHLLRWVQNGRVQSYMGFAFTMVLFGILYLVLR
ncbi:NADH-quinone oxidoreductase subunit L [Sphingobacterium sp. lm-10]|uniref:NADH-quinone oxidoreductase subunit L n=1 Tax=Sphingobacterium sp. lm-10 TaxID=2944904 RepID=UPI00201FCC71|nr:NADH-quinone oxidoreductase subunit L [Sphingobacterium sp. lm-10]MCL7988959.1 NADH-quinone oxidoreductase subunit L [Sphingobacterium sp. lm-10]